MTAAETVAWNRSLPLRYRADVAVFGGGVAGTFAACAAAEAGASVILVERFAVPGGVLTTGGVGNWCGGMEGLGAIFEEIWSNLAAFDALGETRGGGHGQVTRVFDHEILALILQEALLSRGVKLLLHTRLVDAAASDGRVTSAVVCGASGPEALVADQFIDCTGEACLARAAGLETMKGRDADGLQIPMSMMYFLREMDGPVTPQLPAGWFRPIRSAEDLPMTSPWPNGPGGVALKIKVPGYDASDTESLAAAEVRARRRMWEVLDYYQRIGGKPWRFDHGSPIIGIREGRRIVGDYVLTVDDLRAGRRFDDAVARGSFYLDGIRPDNDKREYMLPQDQLEVPPYQIPLRCLIARDAVNVTMAGRCFSGDQLALSSARVAASGAMMGQAAGLAAALAAGRGAEVRDVPPSAVIAALTDRGVVLDI